MTTDRPEEDGTNSRAEPWRPTRQQSSRDHGPISIDVGQSGDWISAEELREAVLAALEGNRDVIVNLGNVNHLDASALQILLALDSEQKRRGRQLGLTNASAHLRQWFEYAGAADQFFHDEADAR